LWLPRLGDPIHLACAEIMGTHKGHPYNAPTLHQHNYTTT